MNKLFISLMAVTVFAGCATVPDQSVVKARNDAIAAVSKVEIFYNAKDEFTVMDLGGSNMSGMSGLFGPIGQLVVMGVDAGSKMTAAERAEKRSTEFMAAITKTGLPQTMNQQFAEAMASRIRVSGREVKITPIERTAGYLWREAFPEIKFTPDYSPLVMRITTGYGAKNATSSYMPTISVEQSLKRSDSYKNIYFDHYSSNTGEPSYFRYEALLEQHSAASDGIRQQLLRSVDVVYQRLFAPLN